MIKLLQNLARLNIRCCVAVQLLLDFEGLKVTEDDTKSILGRLRSLVLKYLPKLEHISRVVPKTICIFENLRSLAVENSGSLRYLFLTSMVNSLVDLETIRLERCDVEQWKR